MSKMFGGIQGIMATDIHHKQSVLHCTLREGGGGGGAGAGDTEAEEEEEVKLVEAWNCEQESKE